MLSMNVEIIYCKLNRLHFNLFIIFSEGLWYSTVVRKVKNDNMSNPNIAKSHIYHYQILSTVANSGEDSFYFR